MMAKIVQGGCFKGVVNYVSDKEKAELLVSKGLRNVDKNSLISSFITQSKLNPITKSVAHISLDFSVQDKDKLTNDMMVEIAMDYLNKMGYGNNLKTSLKSIVTIPKSTKCTKMLSNMRKQSANKLSPKNRHVYDNLKRCN